MPGKPTRYMNPLRRTLLQLVRDGYLRIESVGGKEGFNLTAQGWATQKAHTPETHDSTVEQDSGDRPNMEGAA